jgi:hypothetical protein
VVLLGPGCKLVRGQTAEAGVRPGGIVIEPPGFNDPPCHRQATEHVLVEALVTEAPVEALDKSVLDRLSGRDVVPSDAAFFLPAHDGVRSELVAVVAKVISGFLRAATMASRSAHAVSTSAQCSDVVGKGLWARHDRVLSHRAEAMYQLKLEVSQKDAG